MEVGWRAMRVKIESEVPGFVSNRNLVDLATANLDELRSVKEKFRLSRLVYLIT